jgi:hypothetical protein
MMGGHVVSMESRAYKQLCFNVRSGQFSGRTWWIWPRGYDQALDASRDERAGFQTIVSFENWKL